MFSVGILKRFTFIIIATLLISVLYPSVLSAQFKNDEWVGRNAYSDYDTKHKERIPPQYLIKANFIAGYILPLTTNLKNTAQPPVLGGELCLEFPSWGVYPWQQYLGDPSVGVAVSALDLGNRDILGQMIATYPYVLINCAKGKYVQLQYKLGVGLAFMTRTWNDCDTLHGMDVPEANSAIGSIVNAYITTGLSLSFTLPSDVRIHLDAGYIHASNGTILQPNGGVNMLYGSLGASYTISPQQQQRPWRRRMPDFPYEWVLNITASAGSRELYYRDNRSYLIGSMHLGALYTACNWYGVGLGVDAFYDGVFNTQGFTQDMTMAEFDSQTRYTKFNRYLIKEDNIANKFRVGVAVNNEFRIGRVALLFDWGVYVYDPIRNAYSHEHPKYGTHRPMFYTYDIDKEDGWNYFRLGIRARVWDNLYLQAAVKTHLQKAEMLEFGIGYQLPFSRRADHVINGNMSRYYFLHQ